MIIVVLLFLFVFVPPPVLAAPWYVAYENALAALDAGDARRAIVLLEEAVKERPQPGAALRTYGTRFVDYFPYYYLGEAHLALGHDREAAEQLRRSETTGEVAKVPALALDLRRDLAAAEARLAGAAARTAADSLYAAARTHLAAGRLAEAEDALHGAARRADEIHDGAGLPAAIDSTLAAVVARREEVARRAGADAFVRQALASAEAYVEQGDLPRAQVMVEKILADDPSNAAARDLRARLAAALDAAEARLRALLAGAEARLAAGDLAGAHEGLAQARRRAPGDARLAGLEARLAGLEKAGEVQAEVRSAQAAMWDEAVAGGREEFARQRWLAALEALNPGLEKAGEVQAEVRSAQAAMWDEAVAGGREEFARQRWLAALEALNQVPAAVLESRYPEAAAMREEVRRRLAVPSLVLDEPAAGRIYRRRDIEVKARVHAGAGLRRVLASVNGAEPETLLAEPGEHPAAQAEVSRRVAFREGRNMVHLTVEDAGGSTDEREVSFMVRVPLVRKGWFWVVAGLVGVAGGSAGVSLRRQRERQRLREHADRLEQEVARATEELRRSHAELERSHARLEVSHVDLERSHVNLKAQSDQLALANARLEAANRELRATQVKLVQSEKMAALGQLVAGVAHELNNPLGVIKANQDVVRRVGARLGEIAAGLPPAAAAALERNLRLVRELQDGSGKAVERIARIVQSLRSFSRLDEAPFQRADIRETIESALTLLEYRLRDRVEVVRDYGEAEELLCNPAALNQVFMQLLANAADATRERAGARITLRTRRDGDWVEAVVEDNGEGIPEGNLPRVFDPGFTTRGVGVGTGLGLAIVYQIVAEHGGEVGVRSRAGAGASFTVRLPVAGPPRGAAPPPEAGEPAASEPAASAPAASAPAASAPAASAPAASAPAASAPAASAPAASAPTAASGSGSGSRTS